MDKLQEKGSVIDKILQLKDESVLLNREDTTTGRKTKKSEMKQVMVSCKVKRAYRRPCYGPSAGKTVSDMTKASVIVTYDYGGE